MTTLPRFTLISGDVGNYSEETACLVSAAVAKIRFDRGEPMGEATDRIECICPVIRSLAISINDANWWNSDQERTEVLSPYIDKIIETRNKNATVNRAFACAETAIKVFAVSALKASGLSDETNKLLELAIITDEKTAADAATYAARAAARAATYAADAATYAANAANAADAATRAATYAANAAGTDKIVIRQQAIQLLDKLCFMKG